ALGRLLGIPPFFARRVPALEPDFGDPPPLLLEHGPGHLTGLVGRLRRPRVQENVHLSHGNRHVVAQSAAETSAETGSPEDAPVVMDDQIYPPLSGHGRKRTSVS